MNPHAEPTEPCPYCKNDMHAGFVDVGSGSVQCAPYHCDNCGASEIGPELHDWYYKDRNGDVLMLPAKRVYLSFMKKKRAGFGKPLLRPGHPFTETELATGYYRGKVSPYANTIGGEYVDIRTAEAAYELGILDEKSILNPDQPEKRTNP